MERRDFIKLCSMTGLTVVAGVSLDGKPAQAAPYTGTFWVSISANGGWDVTSIVDPKGNNSGGVLMNKYPTSAIPSDPNGVSWAPMSQSPDIIGNVNAEAQAANFETWMAANAKDLLVINGVDNQTNAHDVGQRASVTGNAAEGSAAFGALAAAALQPNAPMGFVSFGGYSGTNGLAPVTRMGDTDTIKLLAFPYRRFPDDAEALWFSDEQAAMIAKAREARFKDKFAKQRLPRVRTALNTLYLSRLGQNELKQLVEYLPDELLPGMAGAFQLAGAAYKAGLCVAATLDTGAGWDHHGAVDTNVTNSLGTLFDPVEGLPAALNVLEDMGIKEKTFISLQSDFGRTPGYNDGDGKDHWPITSMIITGYVDGKKVKPGVKGGTTPGHEALPVDSDRGIVSEGGDLTIKPGHVQNALRRLAGVLDSDAARLNPTTEDANVLQNLIELE